MRDAPWVVPSGWEWRRFGDVAVVASCLTDPAAYPDLPHIAPNHIESETGRLLPYGTVAKDGVTSSKHLFDTGDILYSKIRPYLAKVAVAPSRGLCSADMYPIRPTGVLESRFLRWWMLTREFTRRAAGEQARTVLPKINKRSLYELPVPVAPLDEQRRIVDLLEDQLSRLDAALAGLSKARQRLEAMRKAAVWGALTASGVEGPRINVLPPADSDDGSLPTLPEKWPWRRLGDLADVVGGVTKDAKKQTAADAVEVPYLRVANVQRGRLDLREVTAIRVPRAKADSLRLLPGDVLLNEGGDRDKLGRGWVWEGQIDGCIHQNHVFRARVRGGAIDPYLLSWAGNYIGGGWCERNGRQSVNLASISLSKIRLMPVPVPPRDLQPALRSRIESVLSSSTRLEAAITAGERRAEGLRRALLEAAFSGRLTGPRSNTEIVEELAAAGV